MTIKGEDNQVLETEKIVAPIWHRGWVIKPEFIYGDGTMDIRYYKFQEPELCGIVARGTIDKAKEEINQRIKDL